MADDLNTDLDPETLETRIVTGEAEAQPEVTNNVTSERKAKPGGRFDVGEMMGEAPTMPEVQQHAIDAARQDAASSQASTKPGVAEKGKTDADGRLFDPSIHEGPGVLNRDGFLKKLRGRAAQRASAASTSSPSGAGSAANHSKLDLGGPQPVDRKTQQAEELEAKIASTAAVSAQLIFTAGQLIGGPEFKPEDGEVSGMTGAFSEYYRVRGIVDLPPEVMLGVAIVGYVVPRWNKPLFKEKRQGWWQRFKSKRDDKNLHPAAIRPLPA